MARVWPPSKDHMQHLAQLAQQEDNFQLELPPIHVQDHMIALYFTYIHPAFPVIHKTRFLTDYEAR